MRSDIKGQEHYLCKMARASYKELVDLAAQPSQLKGTGHENFRTAAMTLVSDIISQMVAKSATETTAQIAVDMAHQEAL